MKTILLSCLCAVATFAIEPVVSSSWLDKNLAHKGLRVVEISSQESYKAGHIPDATHTSIDKWRADNGTFISIKEKQLIQDEIQRLGIDERSEVVLYADIQTPKDFLKASYIYWALNYHGIENVALLDGGKQAWIQEIAHLQKGTTAITKTAYIVKINPDLIANREYVQKNIAKLPMIDARPADKYLGITPTATVKRDGHIQGAMSYSWNYSVEQNYKLKETQKLDTFFQDGYGLDKKSEVLVYCTGGLETSFNYFVLSALLGFEHVRLYDASMKEWGNREDTPMTQYKYEMFTK